jgi:MFS family permease
MLAPLRHRDYRLYWLGQFPAVLAQNMQFVALAWLVLQLTNSPAMLGINGLLQAIPNILLTVVGGAAADRMDRKKLLIASQAGAGVLFFGLGTLVAADLIQIWMVMVFAALLGCVRSFDGPSRQALLPLLVPRDEIAAAVPLGNIVWSGTRLVGPAVAGMLIYTVGIGHTMYFAAASFLASIVLISLVRVESATAKGRGSSFTRNILDGFAYIRGNGIVASLIGLTFFNSVFGMSYSTMMPVMARDVLRVGSQGFGFLQTAGAIGALVGTVGVGLLARSRRKGLQMIAGAATFGVLIVVFSMSTSYVTSLGLLCLMGIANQVYMNTVATTLQLTLPDEFRGRVMGVWGLTFSLMPLGGTFSGAIAEHAGAPIALAIGGVLVTLMALTVGAAVPGVRRLTLTDASS